MDRPSAVLNMTSVDAKLKWAIAHFEAVDEEISTWLKTTGYSVIPHRDANFTQFWLAAHMPGELPNFERWSLMLGDCFTNLRDTLDHAVYAIASLPNSPRPDKREKACFLTASCQREFDNWSKTKLASVPDSVRSTILRFQSFNRPHFVLPPLMALLGELANGNKHRILNVVMAIPGLSEAQFESVDSSNQEPTVYTPVTEMYDGAIVLLLEFKNPEPTMKLNFIDSALCVAVKHTARDGNKSWGSDRTPYNILFPLLLHEVATILDELRNSIPKIAVG